MLYTILFPTLSNSILIELSNLYRLVFIVPLIKALESIVQHNFICPPDNKGTFFFSNSPSLIMHLSKILNLKTSPTFFL